MARLPTMVAQDELRSGSLQLYTEAPNIAELFYAVILQRYSFSAKRSLQTRNSPFGLAMECFRDNRYWPTLAECDRHKAAEAATQYLLQTLDRLHPQRK